MTRFSIHWLDLREAADQRARSKKLLTRAQRFLQSGEPGQSSETGSIVVDLGAGTGSTFRAFSSGPGHKLMSQTWRLIDNDPDLLGEAQRRLADLARIECHQLNLNEISELPLSGARLVTSSALFDLVSASFVQDFSKALHAQSQHGPLCFYSALNYDGTTSWTPAHPLDADVLSAFNRDQARDKGFGTALGPKAAEFMEQTFLELGGTVETAASPWQLESADAEMLNVLISGMGDAVLNDPALDAAALRDWIQFRMTHVRSGTCRIGHTDLLAVLGGISESA